jgi:hypothetical protein
MNFDHDLALRMLKEILDRLAAGISLQLDINWLELFGHNEAEIKSAASTFAKANGCSFLYNDKPKRGTFIRAFTNPELRSLLDRSN